ncbi:hypothetical protein Pmani_031963 [Petrolisthes manimaculis]|uniref:Uncharacterized protein n=1 Tax=Petrolisthes manimaculis TaxID=1843537 RepID=A0AAE1TU91_9EUCA|nr:hypothetical protein Pmani_031963 [Petrolisthes manimaculis]
MNVKNLNIPIAKRRETRKLTRPQTDRQIRGSDRYTLTSRALPIPYHRRRQESRQSVGKGSREMQRSAPHSLLRPTESQSHQ